MTLMMVPVAIIDSPSSYGFDNSTGGTAEVNQRAPLLGILHSPASEGDRHFGWDVGARKATLLAPVPAVDRLRLRAGHRWHEQIAGAPDVLAGL
jgi:hypothetical protein